MLRRDAANIKSGEALLLRHSPEDEMDIIVDATARDPLSPTNQPHVIPRGTILAPLGATGHYAAVRRTTLATNMAATTVAQVVDARPFATGDVCSIFTVTGDYEVAVTVAAAATVAALDYALNTLTFGGAVAAAATGAYVEVAINGHMAMLAHPTSYDAVILLDDLQNQTDPPAATTFCVPSRGAFGGSARSANLRGPSNAGPDPLIEYAMRNFTFIPATPGA